MGLALAALAAGVVLLYIWLAGHWFARVLAFLVLVIPVSFLGSAYGEPYHAGLLGLILGGVAAWFLAGIPVYVRRHHTVPARASQGAPFAEARPSLYLKN